MHSPYLRHLKEIPDGSCHASAMKQNLFCIQPVYTTRVCIQWPICIIGSHDYCHAPLGVSCIRSPHKMYGKWLPWSIKCLAARVQHVLQPSFWDYLLRILQVLLQCIANALKLFVGSKNMANSTAMIAEQRLDQIKIDLHDLYFHS